jgi:hypothetical protein
VVNDSLSIALSINWTKFLFLWLFQLIFCHCKKPLLLCTIGQQQFPLIPPTLWPLDAPIIGQQNGNGHVGTFAAGGGSNCVVLVMKRKNQKC